MGRKKKLAAQQRQEAKAPAVAVGAKGAKPKIARSKKVLFSAATCLGFFALLELAFRAAGVPTQLEREDPFLGFSGLVSVFERDGNVYRTRRSVAGTTFNDQSFLADKPANGLRLFSLGGSSAYGFPWGADVAFTSMVGEALAANHPERQVEAINAAGISYAMHRLNIVADELLTYQPDVLLIYSGHNEFIEPEYFESLKHRGAARTRVQYALAAHSRIYGGMSLVADRLRKQQSGPARQMDLTVQRDQSRVYSPQEKEVIVAEFRWRLERLVGRAQAAGVKVVLATVPCNLRQWRPRASVGMESLSEQDRQQWSDLVASGGRCLKAADFEAAARDLEQAARLAPHHAETQFLLAQAWEGLGRFDDARAAYERACDEDASPIRRVSGINQAIRDVAQRHGTLLVDMDEIFTQHSEHGLVGFNLIEDYVHPTPEGHQLIARCLWGAMEEAGWFDGKRAAPQALFDRLVAERHPKKPARNASWFFNQGYVLQSQGYLEQAIASYRQALLESPNYPAASRNLGIALLKTGQFAAALEVSQQLVAQDPTSAEGHNNSGDALRALGRAEESLPHYQEALRIKPDYAEAQLGWGSALNTLGRPQEAIAHCEAALRIKPDYAEAHYNWGNALNALKRPAEAIVHYEAALRIKPDYAEVHNNWGSTLVLQGRLTEALTHYQQALKLQPDHAAARDNLRRLEQRIQSQSGSSNP